MNRLLLVFSFLFAAASFCVGFAVATLDDQVLVACGLRRQALGVGAVPATDGNLAIPLAAVYGDGAGREVVGIVRQGRLDIEEVPVVVLRAESGFVIVDPVAGLLEAESEVLVGFDTGWRDGVDLLCEGK